MRTRELPDASQQILLLFRHDERAAKVEGGDGEVAAVSADTVGKVRSGASVAIGV